ncbi:peptidase M48 [Bacteroidetes/Chlorobi group bacterium ChocPot_Mid]|nr:MAG: peptidase M48 [Bacteroidetes/Chlorobi group bacterium ChocPot_Mid]
MKHILLKKKVLLTGIFILFFSVLNYSCDSDSITNPNIFTLEDDVALGQDLDAQIKKNTTEYPILNNQSARQYVQNMINEIIKSPEVKYEETFKYQIEIIQRDDVINAFAAPGGYLYVYTGLLKFVENEATLAAVLAHEVAHAERRHATKRMTKQYGVSFLLDLILGDNPSQLEELGANMLTGLAFLKNSRDDEFEADEYSFKYLQSTKWYPGGITFFFKKISDNSSGGFLDELLSTHPMPEDRVKAVEDMINKAKIPAPSESNLFTTAYQNFLKTLP